MFAICIISYNRPKELVHLLESIADLEGLSLLREVIVIDNASEANMSPFTNYLAQNTTLPITFIRNKENTGVSRARNQAAALATAPYICFIDDDSVIADKKYLLKLEKLWKNPPLYQNERNGSRRPLGIIACRIHDFHTHTPPPPIIFPINIFARERIRKCGRIFLLIIF